MTDGPFGQLALGTTVLHGFAYTFTDLGTSGTAILDNTKGTGYTAASFEVGLGRVVVFGDEEMFWSSGASGCGTALYSSESETLMLNAVAYVMPDSNFAFDRCPGFNDTLDADGDGVPDGCDTCPGFDDLIDSDSDGVPDCSDFCPNTAGPSANGCPENVTNLSTGIQYSDIEAAIDAATNGQEILCPPGCIFRARRSPCEVAIRRIPVSLPIPLSTWVEPILSVVKVWIR